MGSSQSNAVTIQTSITNDFLQQMDEICSADCVNSSSGNTIIIGGKTGDISITATCTADASCSMTNQANATAQSVISNMASQDVTSVTDFLGDLSWQDLSNSLTVSTSIVNQITQITTQTCNATSMSTTDNNFVYVEQGGETGNLAISATGNANASCAMSNMAKMDAYNQVQTTTDQTNTDVGMFAAIGIAILAIVLIGGIIFVLLIAVGAIGFMFSGKGSTESPDTVAGLDTSTVIEMANSYKTTGSISTGGLSQDQLLAQVNKLIS